eukprot:tig00020510_g9933.t1
MQLHGVVAAIVASVVAAINAATSAAQAAGRAGRRRTPDAAQLASALAEAANERIPMFNSTKRSLDESRFVVAVMGRFKAGKSTSLNAFLGHRLQPAAVQPETAVPVEVLHAPARTTPLLRIAGSGGQPEELVEGPEAIRARLEAINDEARANPDTLARFDGRLTVEAPLELLKTLPANEARFSFFDVAGKGEFGAEHLSAASDSILRIANYVIVMMEYTKMNEAEGTAALVQLMQQRPHLFETRPGEAWPRVLVLLNKVDAYSSDDQRSVKPADAPAWVSAQLRKAGVEISPECILPFSARGALRARLYLLGRATDAEKVELFGENWLKKAEDLIHAKARAGLEKSGLAAVEEWLRALYVDTRRQLAASAADEIRAGLAAIAECAEAELAGAVAAAEEGAGAVDAAAEALACAESFSRAVSAGLELPELLAAGPFEAALSHRVQAVLAAGAALASGDAAARAAARNRLDWPEAVARFDAAALEADGDARYLAAELRLVPGVAGAKAAEALAGPSAERLRGRLAAAAAAVGVPAPALAALGAGPVLAALEAVAGASPAVQWGAVPPPAKREWKETVTEKKTVLRPVEVEVQESYVEHEPRTRVVKKQVPEEYMEDVPVRTWRDDDEHAFWPWSVLGVMLVAGRRNATEGGLYEIKTRQFEVPGLLGIIVGRRHVNEHTLVRKEFAPRRSWRELWLPLRRAPELWTLLRKRSPVSAGLELPELLAAGPFEAALSHRVQAVLAAGAALASGDAAARAAARNRLDWPEAVARFDAAALEADGGCGGEGTEAEAAARAAELRTAVERYLAAELRLVPGVAGAKAAEALAGPSAERLRGRLAAAAAAVGVPAPALAALGAGPVLAALEAVAGASPAVQWGAVPPPAKREWKETVTEKKTVLRPVEVEVQESYVEHEPRTRVVKKQVPEEYMEDVPVRTWRDDDEHAFWPWSVLGVMLVAGRRNATEGGLYEIKTRQVEVPGLLGIIVGRRHVNEHTLEPCVEPVVKQRTVTKVKERALAEAARPALDALNKSAAERAAAAQAALAAARADEAEARRVLEELAAARATLDTALDAAPTSGAASTPAPPTSEPTAPAADDETRAVQRLAEGGALEDVGSQLTLERLRINGAFGG